MVKTEKLLCVTGEIKTLVRSWAVRITAVHVPIYYLCLRFVPSLLGSFSNVCSIYCFHQAQIRIRGDEILDYYRNINSSIGNTR